MAVTTDITVVGLGAMGSALARAQLRAGHKLTVWNRDPRKAEPLSAEGAVAAATLPEAIASSMPAPMRLEASLRPGASLAVWSDVVDLIQSQAHDAGIGSELPESSPASTNAPSMPATGMRTWPRFTRSWAGDGKDAVIEKRIADKARAPALVDAM